MRKVGIITLNGYTNYGNRLQNYALQTLIQNQGFEVETLLVQKGNSTRDRQKFIVFKQVVKKVLVFCKRVFINNKHDKVRMNKFKEFSKNNINESNFYISENNLPAKIINDFDYFVSGSDQVWNPYYNEQSSVYFLDFVPANKRISYAASFGITELPQECVSNYKKWLSNIPHISVREEAGVEIINQLTGREDVQVVLDPTLMLKREQWLAISKKSMKKPKSDYLLTYFLGGLSPSNEKKIKQFAENNDLKIVNLSNKKDKEAYILDPAEFLDYINSASIFLTDSFHGAVFSIIFEKPFAVLEREGSKQSMNSRIDTLLSTFKLNDRKWGEISNIEDIFNVDYSHVSSILESEREKSLTFLKDTLI